MRRRDQPGSEADACAPSTPFSLPQTPVFGLTPREPTSCTPLIPSQADLLKIAQFQYQRSLLTSAFRAFVTNLREEKSEFAQSRIAINHYNRKILTKSFRILREYKLDQKSQRMKYFTAMFFHSQNLMEKGFKAIRKIKEDRENDELKYAEASLLNEKRLMVKVLKAVKVVNKLSRQDRLHLFSATAHYDVNTKTRMFSAWKEYTAEQKEIKRKEDRKLRQIKDYMQSVVKRIYFNNIKEFIRQRREYKQQYHLAIQFSDYQAQRRGFLGFKEMIELKRKRELETEEKIEIQ